MKNLKSRKGGCLFSILKWLLGIAVILAVALYFLSEKIVNSAITTVGTMAGVDMGGNAKIDWANTEFSLNDFYIANPDGFSKGNAMSFKQVLFNPEITLGGLEGSAPFEINEIRIIAPALSLETKGLSNNLSALKDKFAALSSSKKKEAAEPAAKKSDSPARKFIIRKIVFEDGTVSVGGGGKTVEVPLPSFIINDIGVSEGGVTGEEAAADIMIVLISHAIKSGAGNLLNSVNDTGSDAGNAALDIVRGFLK